jgi:WhiB family redox-sensing transcriptional regulator
MPWLEDSACAGAELEIFFPENEAAGWQATAAKALCRACPVRNECLAWALETESLTGIYAGTTGHQRRAILRKAPK